MLRAGAIDLVQFEYNWRWIEARSFLRDVFQLVLPLGYSLGKVTGRGIECYEAWHPEFETFKEGNYLLFREPLPASLPRVTWWV